MIVCDFYHQDRKYLEFFVVYDNEDPVGRRTKMFWYTESNRITVSNPAVIDHVDNPHIDLPKNWIFA